MKTGRQIVDEIARAFPARDFDRQRERPLTAKTGVRVP
jgi:hypothetical protein